MCNFQHYSLFFSAIDLQCDINIKEQKSTFLRHSIALGTMFIHQLLPHKLSCCCEYLFSLYFKIIFSPVSFIFIKPGCQSFKYVIYIRIDSVFVTSFWLGDSSCSEAELKLYSNQMWQWGFFPQECPGIYLCFRTLLFWEKKSVNAVYLVHCFIRIVCVPNKAYTFVSVLKSKFTWC